MINIVSANHRFLAHELYKFAPGFRGKISRAAVLCCLQFVHGTLHPSIPPSIPISAPEIDFFEVMYMDVFPDPLLSASLQVAPGKAKMRPFLGQKPNVTWYEPLLDNGGSLNLYYFGAHTWDTNKTEAYQTDTVSVNYWLNASFYDEFHKFRIEWEPPVEHMVDSPSPLSRGGYIKWFIDGKLISAIVGDDLQKVSETEIPSEPMSILLNQALSKDWGFPDAYFLDCPKKCWSCLDPKCECALPKNFCKKNVPASFEIDYVRVYQVKDDDRHILGCSPPSRPTKEWIEGHNERYILWESPNGTQPLKPIQRGGGSCTTNVTCGGDDRGYCDEVMGCLCSPGWTGPHCLSAYLDATVDMYEEFLSTPEINGGMSTFVMILLSFLGVAVVGALVVLGWKTFEARPKSDYQLIPTNGESGNGITLTL